MILGIRTDTQDLEGKIVSYGDYSDVTVEKVYAVFSSLTGLQQQIPPSFSAVKKNGKSLYAWAREGAIIEAAAREIMISELSLTGMLLPDIYFSVSCSKGTYVRSICDTAGERLGCGATLASLIRTRSGCFSLKDALAQTEVSTLSLDQIEKKIINNYDESLQRV